MKESVLRTVVPMLYALLVKLGVVAWLGVSGELWQNLLTLVVTGAIYVALRVGERYKQQVGWLLGYPAEPHYDH